MTMPDPLRGLFVTGTNTGVGKTHVTTMIARTLMRDDIRVGIYKPVCSGSEPGPNGTERWPDVVRLADALDHRFPEELICPQRFEAALAPPDAARRERRIVDRGLLRDGLMKWDGVVDVVLVEGVGGWRSPLSDGETVADLAADFGFPVVLVAGLELGGINHALLTLESIERCGLPIAGVILNQHRPDVPADVAAATADGIRAHANVSVLTTVFRQPIGLLTPDSGVGSVDWRSLCGPVE
jgi:dethiobiotin synthetase